MTSPRQSARLIAKLRKSRKPRTKKRTATKPTRRSLRDLTRPRTSKSNELSLLSLPDEPLTQIVSLLSTSTPSFHAPPAYYLAQTNTRFLKIFRSLFTRITPYTSNPTLPTLSSDHLAAVSRLLGERLRAIHVPEGELWAELPNECPNVEELSFRDDWRSTKVVKRLLESLPLKVLEVYRPCCETLYMANVKLEKLALRGVDITNIDPLILILKNPPKELVLEVDHMNNPRLEKVLTALEKAITRMEKVEIDTPCPQPRQEFHEEVGRMVKELRESGREGTCSVVSLAGPETFRLLRFVDCAARVTLRYGSVEYRNDGPGEESYVTKMVLADHNPWPEVDMSPLEAVLLFKQPEPEWIKRLPPLKHVVVDCEHVLPPITTEVMTVPIPTRPYPELNFPTRELRFGEMHLDSGKLLAFCEAIVQVLHSFKGQTVWMEYIRGYDIPKDKDRLRRHVRCAKYACEYFEQEGGDAGSVIAFLDDVFAKCF